MVARVLYTNAGRIARGNFIFFGPAGAGLGKTGIFRKMWLHDRREMWYGMGMG